VGDPARADLTFAKATLEVLMAEATDLAERLLDGRLATRHHRSPFRLVPFLRTDFWPVAGAALAGALGALWLARSRRPARLPERASPPPPAATRKEPASDD
jgi:hypothetical protein